jgi:ferritin-like protein
MGSNSAVYHEPYEVLSSEAKDLHRALASIGEELEAIDWYQQRAEACGDAELRAILLHNRNEEMEHALMGIEWFRRKVGAFGEKAQTYLFSQGPITEVEARAQGGAGAGGEAAGGSRGGAPPSGGSLGIGSLRGKA